MRTSILSLIALGLCVLQGSNAGLVSDRMSLRSSISQAEFEFVQFITKFGRNYPSKKEYEHRFQAFHKNWLEWQEINSDPANTFTVGVNKFADFDALDWEKMLNFKESPYDASKIHMKSTLKDVPASLDWRDNNAVTAIKDQGSCGSCWSFSSAQGIEGSWAVANNELLVFSEQQLIDCSTEWGNNGCHGGLMIGAWEYMQKKPLALEADYPYQETDRGQTCKDNVIPGKALVDTYHFVAPNSPSHTLDAIQLKPLSVGVQANKVPFQGYTGGIINSDRCGHTNLDHAILLIGYGHDDTLGQDFWLLKNQWGTTWGEDGFVRIFRDDVEGQPAICGILAEVSYTNLV